MSRNSTIDGLKFILSFMVVGLHTGFLRDLSGLANYLTVNGLFRMAVPLFFMINGYYFYTTIKKNKVCQWFKHLFYLYLCWLGFYCYFWFSMDKNISELLLTLIIAPYHLWYLPALMGAGSVLLLFKHIKTRYLFLFLISMFLCGLLIQYAGHAELFHHRFFKDYWLYRNFLFFGFPFLGLGFLIRKHLNFIQKISIYWILCGFLIGLGSLYLEVNFNFQTFGKYKNMDLLGSLLLICPVIFIFCIRFKWSFHSQNWALSANAIYFIHPFFIWLLLSFNHLTSVINTLLIFLLSLFSSLFLIKINQRFQFIL